MRTNELGGSLFRQIRRSFASGAPLQELYDRGVIHSRLLDFMENAPYVHQSKALQLTSKKRNIVIATGTGSGAEWKNGLAWVLIGGLTSSMFLTIIVVPMMYYTVDRIQAKLSRKKAKELHFEEGVV